MGMQFSVTISGDVEFSIEVADLFIDADEVVTSEVGYDTGLKFTDLNVTGGTATIEGRVSMSDVEVSAAELADFNGDERISDLLGYNGSVRLGCDVVIDESPSGFAVVESITGRKSAIEVYTALAAAGFDIGG